MPALIRALTSAVFATLACSAVSTAFAVTVTPFASNLYQSLYAITTDGNALYVTGSTGVLRDFGGNPASGVIGKLPLSGGAMTTLYSSSNYASFSGHVAPFQIVAGAAGTLAWADPDAGAGTGASFLSGDTAGTAPVQFFSTCCGPSVLPGDGVGLARDTAGRLYFSDATGGRVGADPSGGSATQIGPTRYGPDFNTAAYQQIAVAGGKMFIADSGELRSVNLAGAAALIDQSAFLAPGVRWIATDGSTGFVDLSLGKIDRPHGVVVVGNSLFVTSAKALWQVNISSGKTKKVVADSRFQDLQGLTVANGALYVLDSRTTYGPFVSGVAEATSDGPGMIWKITP